MEGDHDLTDNLLVKILGDALQQYYALTITEICNKYNVNIDEVIELKDVPNGEESMYKLFDPEFPISDLKRNDYHSDSSMSMEERIKFYSWAEKMELYFRKNRRMIYQIDGVVKYAGNTDEISTLFRKWCKTEGINDDNIGILWHKLPYFDEHFPSKEIMLKQSKYDKMGDVYEFREMVRNVFHQLIAELEKDHESISSIITKSINDSMIRILGDGLQQYYHQAVVELCDEYNVNIQDIMALKQDPNWEQSDETRAKLYRLFDPNFPKMEISTDDNDKDGDDVVTIADMTGTFERLMHEQIGSTAPTLPIERTESRSSTNKPPPYQGYINQHLGRMNQIWSVVVNAGITDRISTLFREFCMTQRINNENVVILEDEFTYFGEVYNFPLMDIVPNGNDDKIDKNKYHKMIMGVFKDIVNKTDKLTIPYSMNLSSTSITYNCNKNGIDPINECDSIKRLLSLLTMYHSLDIIKNDKHRDLFIEQMNDNKEYKEFLNDYIHLISKHSHQLEIINKSLDPKCNDITKCIYSSRHHKREDILEMKSDENIDKPLYFYSSTLDSLHFHLHHLYGIGLRVSSHPDHNEPQKHDMEFSRICSAVNKGRETSKSFERFNNNSKFNFTSDALISFLKENGTSSDVTAPLQNFIKAEEFETDSICVDIEDDIGNIKSKIQDNQLLITWINQFIATNKIKASSFQIGYKFYYWDAYKSVNYGDEINELYVDEKHSSFKDEIREYQYLSLWQYQNTLIPKVTQYMNTKRTRRTKVRTIKAGIDELQYEIKPGSQITYNHILSLCLYTDFSDLCTDFSKSFRKLNPYESLRSVKQRNKNYRFWSMYLRECVELFGDYDDAIWSNNRLKGPFYSGLSFAASFAFTDIELCAPTSTSTEKCIAVRFSGDGDGIIVEFDNHEKQLHGFDCSWLSQYKEESEVLFIGGYKKIRIVGVTVMQSKKTYQAYFRDIIPKFNDMINGEKNIKWSESEISMICDLIDGKVNNKYIKEIDKSICDSFGLLVNGVSHIILSYSQPTKFLNKVMYTIEEDGDIDFYSDSYSKNLFRGDIIFKLFDNLRSIVIDMELREYKFSLGYLLTMISESYSLQNITITQVGDWIADLWSTDKENLSWMFNQYQFDIQYDYEELELNITFNI